jgi:hypothetical protein
MTEQEYDRPVSKLLTLGDCWDQQPWMAYRKLGIGPEHVPELIRLALDEELYRGDPETPHVWAGVHAWRALAQLRAEEAAEPLTQVLRYIDEYDDDCATEELPRVFGLIGPGAIPALEAYLADEDKPLYARVAAAHGLEEIGERHPEARERCIAALAKALGRFSEQDPPLNGFLVLYLVDLDAVEAAPLIERAFQADRVDTMVMGDWQDVQYELGLLEAPRDGEGSGPRGLFSAIDDEIRAEFRKEQARRRLREIGRNEPCWCGSGRKYKQCHLREDQETARA